MAATLQTAFKNLLLDCMLRATTFGANASIKTIEFRAGGVTVKSLAVTSASWTAAANGSAQLILPVSLVNVATGTIDSVRFLDGSGTLLIDSVVPGTSGPEIIVDNLTVSSMGTAVNVISLSLGWQKAVGTWQFNIALRNRLVDVMTGKQTTFGWGTITVTAYSGASWDIDTGSPGTVINTWTGPTWAAAAGGSSAMSNAPSANASSTGSTAYAKMSGGAYAIAGTCTAAGSDFTDSATAQTSGSPYSLTGATMAL